MQIRAVRRFVSLNKVQDSLIYPMILRRRPTTVVASEGVVANLRALAIHMVDTDAKEIHVQCSQSIANRTQQPFQLIGIGKAPDGVAQALNTSFPGLLPRSYLKLTLSVTEVGHGTKSGPSKAPMSA